MEKIKENQLAELLNEWFDEINKGGALPSWYWGRNRIGRIIKQNLKKLKHWKNQSGEHGNKLINEIVKERKNKLDW